MSDTVRTRTARLLSQHQRIVTQPGGPCWCGAWPPADNDVTWMDHVADELERGGVLADEPAPGPCDAETHSWEHYRPEQMDSYWIRCTLSADGHQVHEDSNTGLTWNE